MLLVSGLVSVPKPLSQIQRSTLWLLQGLSPRPSFGGFGLRVGKDPEVIVAPQLAARVHEPRSEYIKDAEDRKLAFVWYALSSTRDSSLNQSYPNQVWKDKARTAIRGCDAVVVLVGQDTHNAQGVIVETDMARSLNNSLGVSGEIIAQAGGGPAEGVDSLQVLLSIV